MRFLWKLGVVASGQNDLSIVAHFSKFPKICGFFANYAFASERTRGEEATRRFAKTPFDAFFFCARYNDWLIAKT